jgi:hypothetical protein
MCAVCLKPDAFLRLFSLSLVERLRLSLARSLAVACGAVAEKVPV